MRLNLSEIIEAPGSVPFDYAMDTDGLDSLSGIAEFAAPIKAIGRVNNSAGALVLEARLVADMLCVCDRCGTMFESRKIQDVAVPLEDKLQDEENPDIFPLGGDYADLDEILSTCFILELETKFLCKEDCAGLCGICGANLNNGPCGCGKKTDPRLAVLEQLLD